MSFDWEQYRKKDQTIDVLQAYVENVYEQKKPEIKTPGMVYISELANMQNISSRQVAAVIFVTACRLDNVVDSNVIPGSVYDEKVESVDNKYLDS